MPSGFADMPERWKRGLSLTTKIPEPEFDSSPRVRPEQGRAGEGEFPFLKARGGYLAPA